MCGLLQVSSPAPAPPPCCPAPAPASTARRWWCRRSASGWWPRPPAPPSPSRWTPAPSPTVSSPVTGSWSRLHGVSTPRCCSELRRVAAAPVDGGQDDGGAGERGPHVRPGRQEGVHRPQVQYSAVQYLQYSAVTGNNTLYSVSRSFARILHIAVSSLHPRPLNYSLAWNTSGPLLPDSLQFEVRCHSQQQ